MLAPVWHRHVVLTIPRLLRPLFRRRRELLTEPGRAAAEAIRSPKRYPGGPLSTTHRSRICIMALVFTRHARKRILERGIRVDQIHEATESPTVVEEYPDDEPYPSRLVMGWAGGRPLHVVLAGPTVTGDTIVVTLYEPGPERWEPGFVRRRPKP